MLYTRAKDTVDLLYVAILSIPVTVREESPTVLPIASDFASEIVVIKSRVASAIVLILMNCISTVAQYRRLFSISCVIRTCVFFSLKFSSSLTAPLGRYSTIKFEIANDSPPQIDFASVMEFAAATISKYLECARNINPTVI